MKAILSSLVMMSMLSSAIVTYAQTNPSTTNTQPLPSMKNQDFTTTIVVDKKPADVYKAINNPRGWWQGTFTGTTDKLNAEFTYEVEGVHYSKQKISELVPDKKVVWLVTDSKLTFVAKKDEWTGTTLRFDIQAEGTKTKVTFTHQGLVPQFECYGDCSNAWAALIEQSLYSYINTGKGVKVF